MTQGIDKLVARYEFDLMEQRMTKDFDGQWVRHSDYATLAKRLEEAEAVIRPFATHGDLYHGWPEEHVPTNRFVGDGAVQSELTLANFRKARRWMEGK